MNLRHIGLACLAALSLDRTAAAQTLNFDTPLSVRMSRPTPCWHAAAVRVHAADHRRKSDRDD
jgi:hypothetical protein